MRKSGCLIYMCCFFVHRESTVLIELEPVLIFPNPLRKHKQKGRNHKALPKERILFVLHVVPLNSVYT